MIARIRRLIYRLKLWWSMRSHETQSFSSYIVTAFLNFFRGGSGKAAALAYYALFSIFPLTLLLAIFVTWLMGPVVAQGQIAQGLGFFLPTDTVSLIQDNVLRSLEQESGFTIIALIGLIWSATGLFSNLTSALEEIFRAPTGRGMLRNRIVSAFMPIGLLLLIALSFVASGVLRVLGALVSSAPSPWISIGILFLPFSINMLIFILMFRFVPNKRVYWEVIWPASIVGAVGWELAKAIFGWYLTNFGNYAVVYGSIATVIVLLLSTYLTASVVILAAEICARMNEWYEENLTGTKILSLKVHKELPKETQP